MTLSLSEVKVNFSKVDFTKLPKPSTNKGDRGQLLELALGIPNSSNLTDMVDGELKTYTKGESIAVTQLNHCIPEILKGVSFNDSKVGRKLERTLYVGFDSNNNFLGFVETNQTTDKEHYRQLEEDYNFICDKIRTAYQLKIELNQLEGQPINRKGKLSYTITGKNKLLQIRTKASKNSKGEYVPEKFNDVILNPNSKMGFYLCGRFGKELM
tara:strand:- start:76 stop:711 length:636 start_codon:yes stop_codon:yes gene_type:complete